MALRAILGEVGEDCKYEARKRNREQEETEQLCMHIRPGRPASPDVHGVEGEAGEDRGVGGFLGLAVVGHRQVGCRPPPPAPPRVRRN